VLDPDRIDYTLMQPDGEDLRFVDADGATVLPHEIEDWNPGGVSWVWVKVPRVDGGSANDFIWMYYGNQAASDGQAAAGVWSPEYRMVYHLHDDFDDSTSGGYHGVNGGSSDTTGAIADGQAFAFQDVVDLGSDLPVLQDVSAATLSAWVRPTNPGFVLSLSVYFGGPPTDFSRAQFGIRSMGGVVCGGRSDDDDSWQRVETGAGLVDTGGWHHVTCVLDYQGDRVSIYVDGALEASGSVDFGQQATSDTPSSMAFLGADANGTEDFYGGDIDEPRVAAGLRSADWIAAQHLSMTDNFILFGPEEIAP
jgi:hypothetical protein